MRTYRYTNGRGELAEMRVYSDGFTVVKAREGMRTFSIPNDGRHWLNRYGYR